MSNEKKTKKPSRLSKNTLKTAKRLLKYVTETYKLRFVLVFVCILISSVASISVSLSLKYMLDDFIIPLIGQESPDFTRFYQALAVLGCVFLMGVLSTFIYTRMMVYIGQGVLKRVRDDMFEHMQTLPIRYFDQNTNGSIMSLYTNDTDTLRQMISQSIPQALMSFFTIIVTFIAMLVLSPLLTLLAVAVIGILILVTKAIGGNSGKYFVRQQVALADVTGFVEERMNGQRVVKVFNHERKSEEEFDALNEALFESAANANKYANIMGPVIGNIGNLQFVLTAVLGGTLSVMGVGGITLGVMASYLQFTKSFTQPFMQVAQQFNSIVMALAGAERIFALIDETPEADEGTVTLVNATKDDNGILHECKERTGIWAWKQTASDGTASYTELTGDVRFKDVTFGYNPDKIILKDISLFAKPGQKIAFVGSNELATTTLFNILTGNMEPDEGSYKWGVTTSQAYFPKDSAAEFNREDTIVEWLTQYSPDPDPTYVRGFLGRMLFAGDDGVKKVKVLSGGEKVRCLISKMMIMGSNVLIFDDPTNHLDMESITALNNGLIKFPGVALFTSHDHQFIQTTANRIMEIVPSGQLIDKITTYDEYLESDEMARKRQGFAEAASDDED